MKKAQKFELVFWGAAMVKFPRYKRNHKTVESAEQTARTVLAKLDNAAAHPAIIYGPGCGRDGMTIAR